MLFSGVLQMAQKLATQHGDCLALVSFWKNSIGSYHENGKVCSLQRGEKICSQYSCLLLQNKYRKAAHMKIASTAGVLGEKIMIDSTYNSLVNDQGLSDTNVEGDLKVEHQNLQLKTGLINLAGK